MLMRVLTTLHNIDRMLSNSFIFSFPLFFQFQLVGTEIEKFKRL